MNRYQNQSILLASKHQKERAIADVFRNQLACNIVVEPFDTDQFGTFTGEVPRPLSPYETCILKAKQAADVYRFPLSMASEGSFGPHPAIPFVPMAHEIMVFIDTSNQWTIAEQLSTTKTNYRQIIIQKNKSIDEFLSAVGFPEHALTVQLNQSKAVIAKGIQQLSELEKSLAKGFKQDAELLLATDMRAMLNPTRMQTLYELAQKLALRISNECPQCQAPGFGFKETQGKLACQDCGAPTSFYEKEVWMCVACDCQEHHPRSDGLNYADPTYCQYCNP